MADAGSTSYKVVHEDVQNSVKDIELVELKTSDHFIFRGDKKDEVITKMKSFLEK